MTVHHLEPTPDTTVQVFDRSIPPVLTVDPGDTVMVESLDAHGFLRPHEHPGDEPATMFADRKGHCLAGPIAIAGAEPGMVLGVSLLSVQPGDWGWTVAGVRDNRLTRRLGVAQGPPSWLLWDIDPGKDTATDQYGHRVDLAPFLGVIGLPPAADGEHSTIPPRPEGGGNIDCRSLVAGSTLYLPVTVPGALLCLGDGHAAQGDGEVSGTAIECPTTTEIVLDLLTETPVPGIHASTPEGLVTFGFDEDLDVAMGDALDAMVGWMASSYEVDRVTALALASPVVDLRITQVANGTWGVHAVLPAGAIETA